LFQGAEIYVLAYSIFHSLHYTENRNICTRSVAIVLLLNHLQVNMSIAILPMSSEFNWNPTTVGLVQSSFFWGYLLTQVSYIYNYLLTLSTVFRKMLQSVQICEVMGCIFEFAFTQFCFLIAIFYSIYIKKYYILHMLHPLLWSSCKYNKLLPFFSCTQLN